VTQHVPLFQVAELVGGGTPSRSNPAFFGGDIDWVTPSDLPPIGHVVELGEVQEKLTEQGVARSSARLISPPAVLFSSRATIGKIAVARRSFTTNQGFINFVPNLDVIDPWFLAYYLRAHLLDIVQLAGETTYKEVSRGKMRDFKIWLPSLGEQQRIVGQISKCLELVAQISNVQTEWRAEAKAFLPSYLSELEASMSWPLMPVSSVILGSQNGRSIRSEGHAGNGRVLTLAAVKDVVLNFQAAKVVPLEPRVAATYSVVEGDVFVSRANTIDLVGLSALALQDGLADTIFPDLLIRLKADRAKIIPLYLAHALRLPSARKQIRSLAKGTSQSMVKISGAELRGVVIPVPSVEEQRAFISQLEEVRITTGLMMENADVKDRQILTNAVLTKAFAGEL
jgi:type I restriction enzyme, S subunit